MSYINISKCKHTNIIRYNYLFEFKCATEHVECRGPSDFHIKDELQWGGVCLNGLE